MKRDDFMKLVATGAITPFIASTAGCSNSNSPKRKETESIVTSSSNENVPQLVIAENAFDSISDLKNAQIDELDTDDTKCVQVLGYYKPGDGGGGLFYWDANEDKKNHNGGTIIDPVHTASLEEKAWWYKSENNTGNGSWKRIVNDYVDAIWFGIQQNSNMAAKLENAINATKGTLQKKLIISNYDLELEDTVTSILDDITIEFTNGAQISQPAPSTKKDWKHQRKILKLTGNNLTIIDLHANGKFENDNLNEIPSPLKKFIEISGDNISFKGKTIIENSGGYGLDVFGDNVHVEDIYVKNNAYSGFRFFANTDKEIFQVDKFRGYNNFGPIGRKTGLTVNGANFVNKIKIGTYIGHNASLFTEADTKSSNSPTYYKNIQIDYLTIYGDENVEYPDGSQAANFLGKMENVGNLLINDAIFVNDAPATNDTQNFWWHDVDYLKINHLQVDGRIRLGLNNHIGKLTFSYNNNNNPEILTIQDNSYNRVDEVFIDSQPTDDLSSFAGIFGSAINAKMIIKKYDYNNHSINIWRANEKKRDILVSFDDEIDVSSISSIFDQSISYLQKITNVDNPFKITREVQKGEIFRIKDTLFDLWICTKTGTSSWNNNKYTGSAIFKKISNQKVYNDNEKSQIETYLGQNDAGFSILSKKNSKIKPLWWNGDTWIDAQGEKN